ncbi:extracellular solute-binding protein [Lederbergia citrisecunda]
MRKRLVAFLMITICVFFLAGCISIGVGKSKSKVKLTAIIVKHPLTQDVSNMDWLKEAEKKAGVEIEWQEVSSDWEKIKQDLLFSGEIPDLIIGPNAITDAEFAQYPGMFQDLTELIEKHGPNVQQMFQDKPETEVIATQLDGKIYGLPKYQPFGTETATRQFINKQWLDQLGLEVPTTWDELFAVLVAFKENDVNGNGDPNDEIPMDFAPLGMGGFNFFHPTVLLGSVGITITNGGGQGYFVENGVVKNFFIDERAKELITFLHKCWDAGVLTEDILSRDYATYQSVARGNGETANVGFTWGWELSERFGNTLASQYVSLPPLQVSSSSDKQVSWSYDFYGLTYGANMVQMSATAKDKDAAMKFINELYDPIVSMQVLFGSVGSNISDNGEGTYTVLPPEDLGMDPATWKWTTTWGDNGPMYIPDSSQITPSSDLEAIVEQTKPLKAALDGINKEKDVYPEIFIKYSPEDYYVLTQLNSTLMNLSMGAFGKWITEGGMEEEWDAYVQQLESIGITRTIDMMQKYYDEYQENKIDF